MFLTELHESKMHFENGDSLRMLQKSRPEPDIFVVVPKEGLEPSRLATHAPETCASTNSATSVSWPHQLRASEDFGELFELGVFPEFPVGCPGLDSNQHSLRHTPLKRTCLPISPPGLTVFMKNDGRHRRPSSSAFR